MSEISSEQPSSRLLSLDFFRGLTMFLLVAEGTGLWWTLVQDPIRGTFLEHFLYNLSIMHGTDCAFGI